MTETKPRIGDADHLPTLHDIVDRLPDGADYDDGLETRTGDYLGGWVAYREENHDVEAGRSAGVLEVSTEAAAVVGIGTDHPTLVPGGDVVVVRRFRLTLEEIPREADGG